MMCVLGREMPGRFSRFWQKRAEAAFEVAQAERTSIQANPSENSIVSCASTNSRSDMLKTECQNMLDAEEREDHYHEVSRSNHARQCRLGNTPR